MTDIFISYKQEDRKHAHAIAEMFATHGYDVWWDISLLPGQKYENEIYSVIKKAKAVVVLWTPSSVSSDWVKAETTLAMERGILVPSWLEKVELPDPYNTLDTIDLTSWDRSPDDPILQGLLAGVHDLIGKPANDGENISKKKIELVLEKPAKETEFWSAVANKQPQSVKEYRAYLEKYGNDGNFTELAEIRIKELLDYKPVKVTTVLTVCSIVVGIIVGLIQIADRLRWLPADNGSQIKDVEIKMINELPTASINDFRGIWKASYKGDDRNGYTIIILDDTGNIRICKVDEKLEKVEKYYRFKGFNRQQKQLSYEYVKSDNTVVPYSVRLERESLIGKAEKEGGEYVLKPTEKDLKTDLEIFKLCGGLH